ncbi:MAG: AAA family ATPase [Proteobacteria bacterium]|nr:AAA family ATPase [Pseudomonadota bacterium]MBU4356449.1 AAA family ATPase [Pseudomonadota bacterium]MBU4447484.1 AAA family ATPase [Pseudomonadota bacterium]MCG2773826.1 AAA family ATPase [Desulfobacterales bacterium]
MVPHIKQVRILNYKSIGQLSVNLEPFTVLVGPNGSGKSNFIDALSFVKDCLADSLESAFRKRGGLGAVRRRSAGHPTNIEIGIIMDLGNSLLASYSFKISAMFKKKFEVAFEHCKVQGLFKKEHEFKIEKGEFIKEIPGIRPKVSLDRLGLYAASATEEFRPVYDFLTSMRFYSIIPKELRNLQESGTEDHLTPDGSNAAAILRRLKSDNQLAWRYDRLCSLLAKVVRGIKKVEYHAVGQKETIQIKQEVGTKYPWTFDALNMSDGTLRILGLLLAVYQPGLHSVIAIEEPEATVHPAVTELIIEVLMDASNERQVLITTHSPDILDYKHLKDSEIKIVTIENYSTLIAPLSQSSREAIRQHLYTAGELLRSGELTPDIEKAKKESTKQLKLFPFQTRA